MAAFAMFLVAMIDVFVNPRPVTSEPVYRVGMLFLGGYGVLGWVRADWLARGRGFPQLSAVIDLVAVGVLSGVIVGIGGLPPLMFLYVVLVVSNTFTYEQRARVSLNAVTLSSAFTTSLFVQSGVGNTLLAIGCMGGVAIIAEARMRELEQSTLEREFVRGQYERRAMLAVRSARLRTLESDELHARLVEGLVDLGFDDGHLLAVTDDGRTAVAASTDARVAAFPPAPAGAGLGGRVLQQNRTVVIDDYEHWSGQIADRRGIRAVVGVPIRCFGEPIGVLCGSLSTPGEIQTEDVETVEVMALHAGAAAENVRLFEQEVELVDRLIELDQLRNDLLSNVSHELRTPLQAIAGMGETLAERGEHLEASSQKLLVERINANASRLRDRIETLLTYSRFESGQTEPDRRTFDLSELAEDVRDRLDGIDQKPAIEVRGATGAWVDADPRLMEHVLENLVTNALQHAGPEVTIVVDVVDDQVCLRVCDTGPGLTDDEIARATQRFYRGGDPNQRHASGLGLGLSLVSAIVEAHGTTLIVENMPDGRPGACFGFDLPHAAPTLTAVPDTA